MKNALIVIAVALALALIVKTLTSSDTTDSTPAEVAPVAEQSEAKQAAPSAQAATSLVSQAAPGAEVFIISPVNGAEVSSPVTVKFGAKNMAIAKAGDTTKFSGHHHLLINLDQLPDMSMPLPANEQIIHFGGGQTETILELEPGQHKLQLLLGNFAHVPHDSPVLSEPITITVVE